MKINLKNLKYGRDYLANHVSDEQFDMSNYMINPEDFGVLRPYLVPECGAIGCALGWMLRAPEIKTKLNAKSDRFYSKACKNHLGFGVGDIEYDFLFRGEYSKFDNTREGAIGRIDVILKYPELFHE